MKYHTSTYAKQHHIESEKRVGEGARVSNNSKVQRHPTGGARQVRLYDDDWYYLIFFSSLSWGEKTQEECLSGPITLQECKLFVFFEFAFYAISKVCPCLLSGTSCTYDCRTLSLSLSLSSTLYQTMTVFIRRHGTSVCRFMHEGERGFYD